MIVGKGFPPTVSNNWAEKELWLFVSARLVGLGLETGFLRLGLGFSSKSGPKDGAWGNPFSVRLQLLLGNVKGT